jgi:septum formation protein
MPARPIRESLRLILASASPRRVELLRAAGFDFEQCPADIDESRLPNEAAAPYVLRLAETKARAVWRQGTRTLGADTIVLLGSEVLGKPRNPSHARHMLQRLSRRSHAVLTGVAVFDGQRCHTHCERTRVRFRSLMEHEIEEYVASGEPLDKAGAYGIQGGAAKFVESVDGSYSNVVGLPLEAVEAVLR